LLQIEFGLAKKYSDDLGPVVMRGMSSKLKRGWWPGKPKQGYLNKKEKGEIIQVIDEERFPLLRRAIEAFIEGASAEHILNDLNNRWGYRTYVTERTGNRPLSSTTFYRILNDSFYYGKMVWNGMEEELNPDVPRLMTEHEYWLIQAKLGARGIKRPYKHDDVPYRGIIKCSECGSTIIPYPKTKKLATGKTKT
jgi:site-specific DNA recombinase